MDVLDKVGAQDRPALDAFVAENKLDANLFVEVDASGRVTSLRANSDVKVLSESLAALGELRTLYVRFGKVKAVPASYAKLAKLESFTLERHFLKQPPEGLSALRQIKSLSLVDNSLASLPDDLGLPDLESIELDQNPLKQIPPAVLRLAKLTKLSMKDAGVKVLPDELFSLSKLSILILAKNAIARVSPKIGELVDLVELNVANNKLKALPDTLARLGKLEVLSIQSNAIETLPSLHELAALRKVWASRNKIAVIDPRLVARGLEKLDLRDNPVTGFAPPAELRAALRDAPYQTLLRCESALAVNPSDQEYVAIAIEAITTILSDFDEHGSANAEMYGNKPRSYFERRKAGLAG